MPYLEGLFAVFLGDFLKRLMMGRRIKKKSEAPRAESRPMSEPSICRPAPGPT